jgi:hypothetical protein
MSRRAGGGVGPGTLLLILAVICFVMVAAGIDIGKLNLAAIGLALFAGSFIFP